MAWSHLNLLMIMSALLFTHCTKDNSPTPSVDGEKITAQPTNSTAQIKDFLAMVHGNDQLSIRTTYTLDQAIQLAEDGIIHEYSHIDKLNKTPISAVDSVTVTFSGKPLSATDATNVYNAILDKASAMANAINTDSLWLLGVELYVPTSTLTSAKVYIYGLYTDGTTFSTATPTAPNNDLKYGYTGKCTSPNSSDDGAATYLRKYVVSQNSFPSTSGKRIGNLRSFQMESDDIPFFSQHLLDNCKELNPNDPVAGDGNVDSRSLYFDCDGSCNSVSNIADVECITFTYNTDEMYYHRAEVTDIFDEERQYRSNQYLMDIGVAPYTNGNTIRAWLLSGVTYSLYTDDDPNPDPGDIRE